MKPSPRRPSSLVGWKTAKNPPRKKKEKKKTKKRRVLSGRNLAGPRNNLPRPDERPRSDLGCSGFERGEQVSTIGPNQSMAPHRLPWFAFVGCSHIWQEDCFYCSGRHVVRARRPRPLANATGLGGECVARGEGVCSPW